MGSPISLHRDGGTVGEGPDGVLLRKCLKWGSIVGSRVGKQQVIGPKVGS